MVLIYYQDLVKDRYNFIHMYVKQQEKNDNSSSLLCVRVRVYVRQIMLNLYATSVVIENKVEREE